MWNGSSVCSACSRLVTQVIGMNLLIWTLTPCFYTNITIKKLNNIYKSVSNNKMNSWVCYFKKVSYVLVKLCKKTERYIIIDILWEFRRGFLVATHFYDYTVCLIRVVINAYNSPIIHLKSFKQFRLKDIFIKHYNFRIMFDVLFNKWSCLFLFYRTQKLKRKKLKMMKMTLR